ncbi:MAG TPA: coenzyme F420-0:L-glutamate ligase [Solirubrobacterales bacterium]
MAAGVDLVAVQGLPEIGAGDRIGELIAGAVRTQGGELRGGDVVVVSQKVVSKAEGRVRELSRVKPTDRARELAERLDKDPRLVELILGESTELVRAEGGVLIVETSQGLVCANAGIDASNVSGDDQVTLLPEDPDASARRIRAELGAVGNAAPAVVIADSFGRPWRLGQTDVAIGCAGLMPLDDRRGQPDREGRALAATQIAIADQVAAAADLTRTKDAGLPACVVRGLAGFVSADDGPGARALRRPAADDLFRRRD